MREKTLKAQVEDLNRVVQKNSKAIFNVAKAKELL